MNATQTKPDIEGLKKVVEAVRGAPDDRFDMAIWEYEDRPAACGFAGCAVGWFIHFNPTDELKMLHGEPSLDRGDEWLGSWEAVKERFKLDLEQAEHLFEEMAYRRNWLYPSRAAVIARIEQFIREHEGT